MVMKDEEMLKFTAIFYDGAKISKTSNEIPSDTAFRNWIIRKKLDMKHGMIMDITAESIAKKH